MEKVAPRFKKDQLVIENCGYELKILNVGDAYYTAVHTEPAESIDDILERGRIRHRNNSARPFLVEIETLDVEAEPKGENNGIEDIAEIRRQKSNPPLDRRRKKLHQPGDKVSKRVSGTSRK